MFVEQWEDNGLDDRYALTLAQNCPSALITSFTFTITTDDQGDGKRVTDTSTPANEVSRTGVTNVCLKNEEGNADNYFGVLLNKTTYAD